MQSGHVLLSVNSKCCMPHITFTDPSSKLNSCKESAFLKYVYMKTKLWISIPLNQSSMDLLLCKKIVFEAFMFVASNPWKASLVNAAQVTNHNTNLDYKHTKKRKAHMKP